jgi:capsular polysaccharide biosynthesis protein/Mrp family chromosome partitioning ATPase
MDGHDSDRHVPSSIDVLGSIRRHWLVAASIVLVCAVAGAVVPSMQPRHYTATTTVLVGPPVDMLPTAINMATEKEVARSPAVAERAVATLGLEASAAEVLPKISLDVPVDSNILRISASADAPEDARRLANAMGEAYLDFRRESSLNGVEASTALIDERIAALTRRLRRLRSDDAGEAAERAQNRTEASVIHSEISILEQRIALSTTTGIVPGRIIAEATRPLVPSGPPVLAGALFGAVVGLLLALGTVIAIESFDRRVRTTEEVQRAMGARILGEVGVPKGLETSSNGDGMLVDGRGAAALAFRRLRTNLLVALEAGNAPGRRSHRGLRTIAVVAARDDLATSYVAANLGAVLATDGRRVTVVSVAQPSPSRLSAMLHADVEGSPPAGTPWLRDTFMPNLQLAVAAADPDRLGFLDMQDATRIVDIAARNASVVFVAAPPLETGEDGGTLVASSEAALFVTWDDVNSDELGRRRVEMERLGTPLLGVVVLHREPPPTGEHWEVRSREGSDEEEAAVWAPADG